MFVGKISTTNRIFIKHGIDVIMQFISGVLAPRPDREGGRPGAALNETNARTAKDGSFLASLPTMDGRKGLSVQVFPPARPVENMRGKPFKTAP